VRALAALIAAFAAHVALADTVVLKSGREYKGLVTDESDVTVCVATESGEFVFSRGEVAAVTRDGPLAVTGRESKAVEPGAAAVDVVRMRGASRAPRGGRARQVLEVDELDAASMARAQGRPETSLSRRAASLAPVRFDGPVTIYGTSWCGYCRVARAHLRARGVAFQDLDVEKSPEAGRALLALRRRHGLGSGVPVIDLGGRVVQGFDRAAIDAILEGR
jgi:glutaredoxin